jgi:acyl-CoA thioester hydrolase
MTKRFTTELTVQWGDVDLAGVVYYPHFFRYFSIAETEFYRSLGPTMLEIEDSQGIRLPRVDAGCRFLNPAHFGDILNISLEIEKMGSKTIKYLFEVWREKDAIAKGHVIIASVSQEHFKSVPLPDGLREILRPYTPEQGA